MRDRIGVGITTYNAEHYFKELYKSLPFDKIDELVVVNGGEKYNDDYIQCDWIQHVKNRFPSICRNDCISFLLNKNCDYIFIIEDDMIIKDESIFERYVDFSKKTGLKYLCFAGSAPDSGNPENRTPIVSIDYDKDTRVSLYRNMSNEFTMHHKSCYEKVGLYDSQFKCMFDVDLTYREYLHGLSNNYDESYTSSFWWFADIYNSDKLIMNNPETISRIGSGDANKVSKDLQLFYKKHNIQVSQIKRDSLEEVTKRLKQIYTNNKK